MWCDVFFKFNISCTVTVYCIVVFSARCQCPQGWREYEDRCYFFSIDTKSWTDANAFCLEQDSNLMSIQDIHERVRRHNPASRNKISWMCSFLLFRTLALIYFFLYLVVGEDTNQHWDLLDRPEWPCLRKCLGVEWWESFYTVPIVCNTVTTPVSENNSFNLHNQHKSVIIVHSSIYWSLTKIISPLSDTGCKASLITGVMILGKTVVRWSDITLDSGMTRTAV